MGNAESTHASSEAEPHAAAQRAAASDEPWWQEIEHQNLVLQQLPAELLVSAMAQPQTAQTSQTAQTTQTADSLCQLSPAVNKPQQPASELTNELPAAAAAVGVAREQTLEEFKQELHTKRLARQTAVQDLREEVASLRQQLNAAQAETRRWRNKQLAQPLEEQPEAEAAAEAEIAAAAEIDTDDEDPTSRSRHANIELANAQLALQLANADNLQLRGEVDVVQRQVGTLKEVISCCKQMLNVKEEQCAQLKMKLNEIENSFSEREMKIMSNNLRQEYERQLVNIRQLRQLYEERQRVAAAEYENLQRLISIKKDELIAEQEKTKNFEERNQGLLQEVETANAELAKLREECSEHKFEKRALKAEMQAVNMLFSQMVMGFNGKNNLNIDRLNKMLEENRDLLNEMTQAEGSCMDGATLPKLLFELVEQAALAEAGDNKSRSSTPTPTTAAATAMETNEANVATAGAVDLADDVTDCAIANDSSSSGNSNSSGSGSGSSSGNVKSNNSIKKHRRRSGSGCGSAAAGAAVAATFKSHEPEIMDKVATAQEIIGNLPKVWKVLMELLSHHKIERVQFEELPAAEDMQQKVGAKMPELSVSKTYIKLKDLILEKKSLVKETNRLKTLNSHLDYRLNEQEKRLSAVSLELTKTWHLVGKMQRQHRQLHTQEQILRYQLQQKRRLLSELKDELEYCRRKWAAARAKNDESQEQCDDLRREFARRKLEDANHSAESGYSDSGPQSDEDTPVTDVADAAVAVAVAVAVTGGEASGTDELSSASTETAGNCRHKHLRDQFEHTRRIKRMQSTSPGRAAAVSGMQAAGAGADGEESDEIVLRWNSAPPTCGWREGYDDEDAEAVNAEAASGSMPKSLHNSRSKQRGTADAALSKTAAAALVASATTEVDAGGRASRIQKLEQQCETLEQQVLETTGNRERLEVQLCRFHDEIAPVQHAVPLNEFINRNRLERMTRASSAPATGTLTPREEEYTRKRSERLGRLEEESKQLISRIKRTTDRGHYLKKSLDRIRRAPSREASFESNTEEEAQPSCSSVAAEAANPLTAEEQAYTARRTARIERMQQESQQLLAQLSRNSQRGDRLADRLDTLHERYDTAEQAQPAAQTVASISQTVDQRLDDIERISAIRAERLRLLEQQGNELIQRLSHTSERGTAMINRIAEREASRRQEAELVEQATPTEEAASVSNNIASSRIVCAVADSGAACCVTVTTTPSQLAVQQQSTGAIPKTTTTVKPKPMAHLCAATRQEDASKKRLLAKCHTHGECAEQPETLEDMVQRLRALPFPASDEPQVRQETTEIKTEDDTPAQADKDNANA